MDNEDCWGTIEPQINIHYVKEGNLCASSNRKTLNKEFAKFIQIFHPTHRLCQKNREGKWKGKRIRQTYYR